jgi:hypothetical protein
MTGHYENPTELPRSVACAQLKEGDAKARIQALLSLALYDPDWRWVQDKSLELLHDADSDVVSTAILAIGHLARRHRSLELDRVLPELHRLRADPAFSGRAGDVLDDIHTYVTTDGA